MKYSYRRQSLELILPRAELFQENMDSLQQWIISTEQDIAELRSENRPTLLLQEAIHQAKVSLFTSLCFYH